MTLTTLLLQAVSAALCLGALAGGLVLHLSPSKEELSQFRVGKTDEGYLPSSTCLPCHPDHHASWLRTHHSRMTQEASQGKVQGTFAENTETVLNYLGHSAYMTRRNNRFQIRIVSPAPASLEGRPGPLTEQVQVYDVHRIVGSRRIEQYLTRDEAGRYLRLPIAFDLTNRRFMHLAGSFFHPDPQQGQESAAYFRHLTRWDNNCVFCHNVKAQPHLDTKGAVTEVSELGIACGACHGAAAQHIAAAASPLRRTYWRLFPKEDRQIQNPAKMTKERSLMVCGHCHGQRVPEPIARIQTIVGPGDPYNAGEDLREYYRPVDRGTKIGEFSFATRFWPSGTARLTAYEYQGMLRSPCATKGNLTCLSCHSMHEGDPRGQLRPELEGGKLDRVCLGCHSKYAEPTQAQRHSAHKEGQTACADCHMPRVVYGVMSIHRSHEIRIPKLDADGLQHAHDGEPNACGQCHLNQSLRWAQAGYGRLFPPSNQTPGGEMDPLFDVPEGIRLLFAGDALGRALAAEALSYETKRGHLQASWVVPYLIEAMTDPYPIVRYFVLQGLGLLLSSEMALPSYLAPLTELQKAQETLGMLPAYGSSRTQVQGLSKALRERRVHVDIEVGE